MLAQKYNRHNSHVRDCLAGQLSNFIRLNFPFAILDVNELMGTYYNLFIYHAHQVDSKSDKSFLLLGGVSLAIGGVSALTSIP